MVAGALIVIMRVQNKFSDCGDQMFRSGCSSMVEQQPSKLNTRVRFPSPAPKKDGWYCKTGRQTGTGSGPDKRVRRAKGEKNARSERRPQDGSENLLGLRNKSCESRFTFPSPAPICPMVGRFLTLIS